MAYVQNAHHYYKDVNYAQTVPHAHTVHQHISSTQHQNVSYVFPVFGGVHTVTHLPSALTAMMVYTCKLMSVSCVVMR